MSTGTVTAFDADRGLGTITDDDGASYLFHLVEIADGSRDIDVGQTVRFRELARFGEIQAASIAKI